MPTYGSVSVIRREGGLLIGERREITNYWAADGPHNDDAAIKAGFRGAVVSGFIHTEQFTPLAFEAFGKEWFERGSFSLYYRNPAYDGNEIQAFMRDPGKARDGVQVQAWSENAAGQRIAEGTFSLGAMTDPTELRRRFESMPPARDLRILKDVVAGTELGEATKRFPLLPPRGGEGERGNEGQIQRRATTTEPFPWYFGASPWGGAIAGPLAMIRMLSVPQRISRGELVEGVAGGVAGGYEVRFVNGPIFLDHDYLVSGRILGVSESPRTENSWVEITMRDAATGTIVAEALNLNRTMKSASPLYADARA